MYCSICLTTNNRLPSKMYCKNGHTFHIICMEEWRSRNNKCPECRESLLRTTNYYLRSKVIKECDWDRIKHSTPIFKDIDTIIEYIQYIIKQFYNTPTTSCRFFKIYELYCTFIKNWKMLGNEYQIFELYRRCILDNITLGTVLFKYGTIEFDKVREMMNTFKELQLDYRIETN